MRPVFTQKALIVCHARPVLQELLYNFICAYNVLNCLKKQSTRRGAPLKEFFQRPSLFNTSHRRVFFSSFAWCCALELEQKRLTRNVVLRT